MPSNKNICKCPSPPGGEATCEAHQLAICRIENGVPITDCISPPPSVVISARLALAERDDSKPALIAGQRISNWTLACFYKKRRLALATLKPNDIEALEAGLGGIPVQSLKAGLTLAPETIPAVRRVVRAAKESGAEASPEGGWSAITPSEKRSESYYLIGHAFPEFYGPDSTEQQDSLSWEKGRYLAFEVRELHKNQWIWMVLGESGGPIAISARTYNSLEECEAEINSVFKGGTSGIRFRHYVE